MKNKLKQLMMLTACTALVAGCQTSTTLDYTSAQSGNVESLYNRSGASSLIGKTKKTVTRTVKQPRIQLADVGPVEVRRPRIVPVAPAQRAPARRAAPAIRYSAPVAAAATTPADLPPTAEPGVCYVRVLEPAKYTMVSEEVMVRPSSRRLEIIPAEYEWVEEQVVVKQQGARVELVEARYEDREVKVEVKPATKRIEEIPAKFETLTERLLVKEGRTYWKRGDDPIENVENMTGDIMCLVTEPPEYETVTRQVVKQQATTKTVEIPAQYKNIRQRVMVEPPTCREVPIPPEYETVRVQKLKKPAEKRYVEIPPAFETVTKKVMTEQARPMWRKVLCKSNVTEDVISRIQAALKNKGYNPGPVNGKSGEQTATAIQQYQQDHNMVQGSLTYRFLDHLGVNP